MRKLTIKLTKADILTLLAERFKFELKASNYVNNIHRGTDEAGDLDIEAHWEGSDDKSKM